MDRLKVLNRNQIKYIVMIAMVIDHIAWAFVPTKTPLGVGMHFIGRLTGPTMAYFLGEGFLHTRNRAKYALRLGIFAIISWIPFSIFEEQSWPTVKFPVIYTLFLGFIALWAWNSEKISYVIKLEIFAGMLILATWGDWSYMDILLPFFVVKYKDDEQMKWRAFTIMCAAWILIGFVEDFHRGLYCLGILMVPVLLRFFYNGEKGSDHPFHKWIFYFFYPLHLLILALLEYNTVWVCGNRITIPWK